MHISGWPSRIWIVWILQLRVSLCQLILLHSTILCLLCWLYDFTFMAMALTGLFWLAIALSGILLSLKRTGGKQGHVQLKQPSQNGTSSNITVSQVSPLHYHQGVVRISRPNSNSRCFQCLSPAHDLNVCSPCLTSGAAAQQSWAMRLYLWNMEPRSRYPLLVLTLNTGITRLALQLGSIDHAYRWLA